MGWHLRHNVNQTGLDDYLKPTIKKCCVVTGTSRIWITILVNEGYTKI